MLLKTLTWPLCISALVISLVFVFAGPQVALIVTILAVLEVSLSFDNAVVNAKILGKMSPYWQKIFLTVGIAIAVFGMRLVFPIMIVAIAAHLGPLAVFSMALTDPGQYGHHLHAAHASIAAFGGMFLLMIFLDFLFEAREITWLGPIERFMARIGKLNALSTIVAIATLYGLALAFGPAHPEITLAGLAGLVTYLLVSGLSSLFESEEGEIKTVAKAGFFSFLYLEVLDASFSFDGVTGAFAISNNILVIALGLGIGALFVRSLTVYLVRAGKLAEYRYLEHGAHYAIGALAIILLVGINHEIPEIVTGLVGVAFIGVAFGHSLLKNKEDRHGVEKETRSSVSRSS